MKSAEEILQKYVPNRFPKDNPYIKAMEEYASQFREKPKKTIEEMKNEFWHKCLDIYHGNVIDNLEWKLLNEFFEYWTEISPNAKKMRFEKEKVFDIKKRLERWKRNQKTFNNGNQQQSTYEKHEQGFDALFGSGSPFSVPES